jgi:hypothetical protein
MRKTDPFPHGKSLSHGKFQGTAWRCPPLPGQIRPFWRRGAERHRAFPPGVRGRRRPCRPPGRGLSPLAIFFHLRHGCLHPRRDDRWRGHGRPRGPCGRDGGPWEISKIFSASESFRGAQNFSVKAMAAMGMGPKWRRPGPRGPARPNWGLCPQLRFPQLSMLRHSVGGGLAKGRGSPLCDLPARLGGACSPRLCRASLPSGHRCRGDGISRREFQRGRSPTVNRRIGSGYEAWPYVLGPVNLHFTVTWKSDRYGPVMQELDFLREGPFTGAVRRSGQCRGPALMEKELRGATCALR